MLIAFCIFKYFPYGGIQRDFFGIAGECLDRGIRVRVYTLSWQGDRPADMDIVEVPVVGMSNHVRYRRFSLWVNEHLKQHPVALVVGMNKMPGLDIYYAGDSCYAEKARSQRHAWYRCTPRYRLFAQFERAVFGADSHSLIFTISDRETQFFRKHYATPLGRFYPLPPGVSRDRLRPHNYRELRARVRTGFALAERDLVLLFIGSGYIKKGLDRAILAFAALPGKLQARSRMLVIGEDKSTRFERLISKLDLADRIHILGGRDDVPRFLFAADILMLPAYDELAGIVIVEAMVAGLPVLVTENCGFAHYVREAEAGLLQPTPFVQQDFNKKLEQMLTSPERVRWQRNGLAFSRKPEIYQLYEKAADKIEELLQGDSEVTAAQNPETDNLFVARTAPLLAFCLFKYFPFGGMQRDFRHILEACLAAGYAARVYTLSWQGDLPDAVELVIVPVTAVTNHARYSRYIRWVLKDLESRPVVMTLGFNKMPGLDFYYAADPCYAEKSLKRRSRLYRSTTRYRFFSRSEEAVFGAAANTQILYLSDQQKSNFQKFYATANERFTLLAPGIERHRRPDNAEQIRGEFRRGFNLSEQDMLLLMIGSGFRTKGVTRSLDALARVNKQGDRSVRLMVIGQDNPAPFRRLAQRLGVSRQFEIIAGREDIPRFLLGADLLLHPAYAENTGSVILEAMIFGLPVIASAVCGYAHYIEEAGAGQILAEPFEQTHFVAHLAAALADAEQRQRWSEAGIAFAKTLDLYRMPEQVLSLINRECARRGAARRQSCWEGAGVAS